MGTPAFAARLRACVHAVLEPLGVAALAPGQPQRREDVPAPAHPEPYQGDTPGEHAACASPAERAAPPPEPRAAAQVGSGLEAGSGLWEGLAPKERAALVEVAALPALLEGAAWRGVAAELARRGACFSAAAVQGAGMYLFQE